MKKQNTLFRQLAFALLFTATSVRPLLGGNLVLTPWSPIFEGIDFATGTNTPNSVNPDLMVVNVMRINLSDPGVRAVVTPRIQNPPWESRVRETAGYTVPRFLQVHQLKIAVNANQFNTDTDFSVSPDYYAPEGTPYVTDGLLLSDDVTVTYQAEPDARATLLFHTNQTASIIPTNWPAASNSGVYAAVTGTYPLVIKGVNIGREYYGSADQIHQINPRTALGLSQDQNTLYILTIDGRQPGYSDGAWDYETGNWLKLLGAYDAVNMDGGGSTTLVMADPAGTPIILNRSSAFADSGQFRTVGAHLGFEANVLPSFFNNIQAVPDDISASIIWTSIQPVTTQLSFGITTNLGTTITGDSLFQTNHSLLLNTLQPSTQYYYQLISSEKTGAVHNSPIYSFITTNYASTNILFGITNTWLYSWANLDGVPWTASSYDDSTWSGPGSGLLWIDVRATPDPDVQPKNTQLPGDPDNGGYPYVTYYFRTHITLTHPPVTTVLSFTDYVDDGAVFYINGNEVYRLRMPAAPTPIVNNMTASGFPCSGDATCPDYFTVTGLGQSLVNGDNVIAVEVHNYNILSPDITFGLELAISSPTGTAPALATAQINGSPAIVWTRGGFALQQAPSPSGPWIDVPGPVAISPYTIPTTNWSQFYRLSR